jgi:hypothetical protein
MELHSPAENKPELIFAWALSKPASESVDVVNSASANVVKPGREPVYSVNVVGIVHGTTAALSAFLPGSDPHQTLDAANRSGVPVPEPLRNRAAAWLQAQAVARLGKKENP